VRVKVRTFINAQHNHKKEKEKEKPNWPFLACKKFILLTTKNIGLEQKDGKMCSKRMDHKSRQEDACI
jgi:hypothetical protein